MVVVDVDLDVDANVMMLVGLVVVGVSKKKHCLHHEIWLVSSLTPNPSQEGYYNSINPLVKERPHIFPGLHLPAGGL